MKRVAASRWRACLVALVRAALLVIVFHSSGLAHFAADVHELVTTGHHAGTPLDPDDDDPTQAPGSPASHHAQPGGASLASPILVSLAAPGSARLAIAEAPSEAPATPLYRGVYRPPRG
ncbi:MAG: hypothetical protein KIT84_11495 [Labilithrix sp.]|nr:hypothetical protein [Labilithrix sp.]MCW5811634.1 hypothetical protein [Labilithrix sp.]